MKTPLNNFLATSGKFQAALVFGNDYGLIASNCDSIINKLVSGSQTIFNFTHLYFSDIIKNPALLYNELNIFSLTKEKKTIYISEVEKSLPAWLKEAILEPRDAVFILLKAPELPANSAIRKLFESEKNLAIIACYHDQHATTENIIRTKLKQHNIAIEKPALDYLAANISADRLITMTELDKLILFAEDSSKISFKQVVELTSQSSNFSLDDFCFDIASGKTDDFSRQLTQLLDHKTSIIAMIRALLRLFHQLLKTRCLVDEGANIDQAMAKLSPPIFFKYTQIFATCLKHYSNKQLHKVIADLTNLELLCKTTNTDHTTLFEYVLLNQIIKT